MKIVRHTESELVVQESTLWISAVCALASLPLFYMATLPGKHYDLIGAIALLLFSWVWMRRSTSVFDASRQQLRWKHIRFARVASGRIPFADIQGITMETTTSDRDNTETCRLAVQTKQGPILMSDVYTADRDRLASMRDAILNFVKATTEPPANMTPAAATDNPDALHASQLNESIRSLLSQGRKVDAILLVQRTDRLDLTEATFRVNQIDNQLRAKSIRR